jgi:hypothetical protein
MRTVITQPQADIRANQPFGVLSRVTLLALFILIAVIVFLTQSGGVGFWKGSHG